MDAALDKIVIVTGQLERLFAMPGSTITIEIAQTRLRFERRTFGAISFPHVAFSPEHKRLRGSGWVLVATVDGEIVSHVNIGDIDRMFVTDGGANDH